MANKILTIIGVVVFGFVYSGGFVSAQTDPVSAQAPHTKRIVVQEVGALDQPYISVSPTDFYPLDEILYLEGRGEPSAEVVVTLKRDKPGEKPLKFNASVDTFGEWVVAEETFLSAGVWRVVARQSLGGDISEESNPRVIRSVVTGVNLFGFQVKYVVITLILLFFFFLLAAVFVYFLRKISTLKRGLLTKQLSETEDRVRENISEIRKELMAELQELASGSQGRQLTPDEVEKRNRILRRLESLERDVDRDIDSLEKKI